MKPISLRKCLSVVLERQGEGRYLAHLASPTRGRVRIGTVLGGRRQWTAEPIGRHPPVHASSRTLVARRLGEWSLTQPGARSLLEGEPGR
jgi:hypothetical protein